jgi:NADPH-dependent 2,4-dienoyl-CoA reductase/sulfur reductase-like enzyme
MESTDLLIVGGGPAGLSAAAGYRDAGGAGSVMLVGEEAVHPYARPPLSKDFLRGDSSEDSLPLQPSARFAEQAVAVRLSRRVEGLDPDTRTATLDGGGQVRYDNCVLATGARPTVLPVPGADHPSVRYLRSLASAQALRVTASSARSAVVIGSGFIGCEAAVSLARRGLSVTVASAEPRPQQARLGPDVGGRIADWLDSENVTLISGAEVRSVVDGCSVNLDGHPAVRADLILVAAGITPCTELAGNAGADLRYGRIVVDDRMRTSVPNLFAAGDVTFPHNTTAGRSLIVEHWGEALEMGRVAGDTIAGGDARWSEVPGFWTTIGDRTLKYAAWGDGYDTTQFVEHNGGGFTAWYTRRGATVGVATHEADQDYELGRQLIEHGEPAPVTARAQARSQIP